MLLVLLIIYGSIGALLACAGAVHTIAVAGKVSLLGMLRVIILWPLAVIAFMVTSTERRGDR